MSSLSLAWWKYQMDTRSLKTIMQPLVEPGPSCVVDIPKHNEQTRTDPQLCKHIFGIPAESAPRIGDSRVCYAQRVVEGQTQSPVLGKYMPPWLLFLSFLEPNFNNSVPSAKGRFNGEIAQSYEWYFARNLFSTRGTTCLGADHIVWTTAMHLQYVNQ